MSEYREAYATLARIATRLESGDADIDEVLPLLEEARAAYEACRGRLEAVRRALGDDLADTDGDDEDAADEDEDEDLDDDEDDPF
ncbi:exodeoxyribonuclease VII small subunit [Deinococcus pimensis]|uniref:exodeoxyribonuclease VII small subunit n=1 Tax=Deinococcus pimensis TaxID=309888 RepID=UPI0004803739|nr:exodeoxyribonuclease VII small subunit [Deinococcus pimensis]